MLDLVGVTVLWIERLAPSPGLSATLSPTGARDTIQASARAARWKWAAVFGSDGASPSRGAVAGSMRAVVFGWIPSGADTEVRPPTIRSLGPGGRSARVDVQRDGGPG